MIRPRRLRTTAAMRRLVREVEVRPRQLVLPAFVGEVAAPIGSIPGVHRHDLDGIRRLAARVAEAGLGGIMLFGVPDEEDKDDEGSAGWDGDGILQRGLRAVRSEVGEAAVVMADMVWLFALTGLFVSGFGTAAAMIGRSGSPSMKVSSTSVSLWRGKCIPWLLPA